MNLPYIQSEIFRELVSLETLLKPDCTIFLPWRQMIFPASSFPRKRKKRNSSSKHTN